MMIDHRLVCEEEGDEHAKPHITDCYIVANRYRSDHRPIAALFTRPTPQTYSGKATDRADTQEAEEALAVGEPYSAKEAAIVFTTAAASLRRRAKSQCPTSSGGDDEATYACCGTLCDSESDSESGEETDAEMSDSAATDDQKHDEHQATRAKVSDNNRQRATQTHIGGTAWEEPQMDILEKIDKFDEGGADQPSACDESTDIEVEPTGAVSYPKDHRPANKALFNADDATDKTQGKKNKPTKPQQEEENRAQEPKQTRKAKFNDPNQPWRRTNPDKPAEARPWAVLMAKAQRGDKGGRATGVRARHTGSRYVVPTRLNTTAPVAKIDVVHHDTGERREGETLFDTGAMINLTTEEAAKRLGCTIIDAKQRRDRPRLTMADGSRTRPTGLTVLPLELAAGIIVQVEAWIMSAGPHDIIIGAPTMEHLHGVVDLGAKCVRMIIPATHGRRKAKRVSVPFELEEGIELVEEAVGLYATKRLVLQPGYHSIIPVNAIRDSHVADGTWGLVTNTAGEQNYAVATGVTTLRRHQNWAQVANITDEPIIFRRGSLVAEFQRKDKSMFTLDKSSDLDTLNKTMALDAEAGHQETHAAAARLETTQQTSPETAYAEHEHLTPLKLGDMAGPDGRSNLKQSEVQRLKAVVLRHHNVWNIDAEKQPAATGIKCSIKLRGPPSAIGHARQFSANPVARKKVAEIVEEQKQRGIIQDSCSPYSSSALLVPKPNGKGVRFCVDYRKLNSIVVREAYPLPRVDDCLGALKGSKYFSSIDITTAFWQVPMDEESRHLTAFATHDGLYEYLRMPMGLCTASAVFSRFVDRILSGLKWHVVLCYADDILVYTPTFDGHIAALDAVLGRLEAQGLTLGADKCHLGASQVRFLGHLVTADGIKPDPDKVEAIKQLTLPEDKKGLKSLMGLFSYYRKFCRDFSTIAAPLHKCLKHNYRVPRGSDGKAAWSEEQHNAFKTLRNMLTQDTMLAHPDWSQPFILDTDACGHGLGGILSQVQDGKERVIMFASRSLNKHEGAYTAWEQETLAVRWACSVFDWYLWGKKVCIRTDSTAVKSILQKATTGRHMRWALALQEVDYEIEHRRGTMHGNADGLSRCPIRSCCPYGNKDAVETIYDCPAPIPASTVTFFPPKDLEAWDLAQVAILQRKDMRCRALVKEVKGTTKSKPSGATRYEVGEKGALYLAAVTDGKRQTPRRLVVPETLKAFILRRHHGIPMSGHGGRKRTKRAIEQRYYWKNMDRDIRRWIRACAICQRRKTPRPLRAGTPKSVCVTQRPWHTAAIDLVGPLPKTSGNGNCYILTILDTFSRWVIAIPIKSKHAREVADALYKHLICQHGTPTRIYSDRGTEFINAGLKSMCKRWGIHKIETTGWQPQANPVERTHRWINSGMTTLYATFGAEWDRYVDAIIFAHNISENESTGFSPFQLTYGRRPAVPEDVMYGLQETEAGFETEAQYHIHCGAWMAKAYKHVHEQQRKMAESNKEARAERMHSTEFEIDQHVMYWKPPRMTAPDDEKNTSGHATKKQRNRHAEAPAKWSPKWTGPHKIVKKWGDTDMHPGRDRAGHN